MRKLPYKEGTIKLTWINPSDYTILHSRMFGDLDSALKAAESSNLGENWLVFELTNTDGVQYAWKVLPHGKHKGYVNGMKLRDNLLLKYGAIALMFLGTLYIYKLINK